MPDSTSNGRPSTAEMGTRNRNVVLAETKQHSTTDPLEINLASADLANHLQGKHISSVVRSLAWILLVVPSVVAASIVTYQVWHDPSGPNVIHLESAGDLTIDFLFKLFMSGFCWAFPGYWIVVLCRRPKSR